jgi:potassium uptake TrkH family protein
MLTVALIGTTILFLPVSHSGAVEISALDALFTSVSALCVTGLTTVDTAIAWTPLGHVTILALIQLGGLGIMFLASAVALFIGRRLTLSSRMDAGQENSSLSAVDIVRTMKGIAKLTFAIEGVLAVILTVRFYEAYDHDWGSALWHGVFHSVSAFNNAGFALYSDSITGFATDPWITATLCVGIILGSFGYPVLAQLRKEFRHVYRWSMNTNLVIFMFVILFFAGAFAIAAFEWANPNTLGPMSVIDKIQTAFFHSVQARSSGFNTIDLAQVNPETLLVLDILMFIGAGPGGTGGGIKVTTFAVLMFIVFAELRGDSVVNIFGKRLSRAVHREAITIALFAVGAVMAATIAIVYISKERLDFVLFEVISAFATVGSSTGLSASLDPVSQTILVILMFIGRIGPLTIGASLALKQRPPLYQFPKERPAIG